MEPNEAAVIDIFPDLKCCICHNIMWQPVSFACAHPACLKCMTWWLLEKKECPMCRTVQLGKLPMDQPILQRLVARIVVSCPHSNNLLEKSQGSDADKDWDIIEEINDNRKEIKDSIVCTWKGAQDERDRHLSYECPLEAISCIYGCDEEIPRYRRDVHLNECIRRPIPCDLCKGDIAFKDMKSHQSETCPKRMIECPRCAVLIIDETRIDHLANHCIHRHVKCKCGDNIVLSNMERHTTEACILRLIPCSKCSQTIIFKLLDTHLSSECPERIIQCRDCSIHIEHKSLEHHKTECPCSPTTCTACSKTINLNMFTIHTTSICAKRIVSCRRCNIPMQADKCELHLLSGECPKPANVVCYYCHTIVPQLKFKEHKCSAPIYNSIHNSSISFGTTKDYLESKSLEKSIANPIYQIDKKAAEAYLSKNKLVIGDWDVAKMSDTLLVLSIFHKCADCDRRICRHAPYWVQMRYCSNCLFEVYLCNVCIDRVQHTEHLSVRDR
ncbi:MAG: hypothetical protein Hyperionvirus3_134 [Hyperionvirus sp.]|uniref:Uncharacterized protein n=1 Tax=Hyperionvirus sp. TaxID=2487770 RepID=A0A3G5A736_9VIRU|nr:MAG: hypothetical protein Hyperionvirus3_134 [Hyperionvirus sp.]